MATDVKAAGRFPRRAEAARRTRSRIREVAAALFVEQGYVLTTVGQIASAAQVAPRTVFNAFPDGKAQLFAEALDAALGGDETRVPLAQRAAAMAALGEADATAALAHLVDFTDELYDRAGPLIATYLGSAGADPEMRRHADLGAAEAGRIMQSIAAGLDARGWLRPGMPASEAGDALLALCSPQVHQLLRTQRGWTSARYRAWLTETIGTTVLTPAARTGAAGQGQKGTGGPATERSAGT